MLENTHLCWGWEGWGEWKVEKERVMGLSPLGKEEGQKSVFTMAFLGFKMGRERMVKSGNLSNYFLSTRKQAMYS